MYHYILWKFPHIKIRPIFRDQKCLNGAVKASIRVFINVIVVVQ